MFVDCCSWVVNQDGVLYQNPLENGRTTLREEKPGSGQLEQEPDGQGAHMEAVWATSHGNIMWIVRTYSRSVMGASHKSVFMGDCLTISHMCIALSAW